MRNQQHEIEKTGATRPEIGRLTVLLISGSLTLAIAGIYLGLTLRSGLNYHLFPAVIAAAPAVTASVLMIRGQACRSIRLMLMIGVSAVAGTWLLLVLLDAAPVAPFVQGQPGGAPAEAVVMTMLGVYYGRRKLLQAIRQEDA